MNAAPAPADLTLEELCREASRRLREAGLAEAADGRVSPEPDARTVRYYGTLGLVDRPRIEGQRAVYGRRQLLQLLAVKALQARGGGLKLAEIQARLYGRSERELEGLVAAVAREARERSAAAPPTPRAVVWREVVLEPGVKLMVEEGWSPVKDPAMLSEEVAAALRALAAREGGRTS